MKGIPSNVSESVRKRNPHLYAVGAVEAGVAKPVAAPALANRVVKHKRRASGVRVLVSLTAFRRRPLDDDNNASSFKPIRDKIARELGVDDADPRIKFETSQILTQGQEGVLVKIQTL